MADTDPDELLTPQQAAALVGIRADTLSQWARDGRIRSTRTRAGGHRRFRRGDVLAMVQTEEPTAEPAQASA